MKANTDNHMPLEQQAFLQMARTTSVVSANIVCLLKQHGLSESLYNVLRILRGAGEEGLRVQEIWKRMITRVPDMTRLLDRLEGRDLIRRDRSTSDRRAVQVHITQEGLEVLDELDTPVRRTHEAALSHMSEDELSQLISLLKKARQSDSDSWQVGGRC